MGRFSHLMNCMEMSETDVMEALGSREGCVELLARFAEIAKPGGGSARLLFLFARMATIACGWVDGDLSIEIKLDGDATRIEAMSELAAGLRERLLPPVTIRAPFAEFVLAVERFPHVIHPLAVRKKTWRRIVLVANEETRKTTMPPPMIEISEESLAEVPRAPPPPLVVAAEEQAGAQPGSPRPPPELGATEDDTDDVDGGW
jgi:hypothetical protein